MRQASLHSMQRFCTIMQYCWWLSSHLRGRMTLAIVTISSKPSCCGPCKPFQQHTGKNKLKLHSQRRRLLFNTVEGGIKSADRPIYVNYKFNKNKYIYTPTLHQLKILWGHRYSNCLVYSCVVIFTLLIVPISTAEVKRLEPFREETLIFTGCEVTLVFFLR